MQRNQKLSMLLLCSLRHPLHSLEPESASWTHWPPAWPVSERQCCALQTQSSPQTAKRKSTQTKMNEFFILHVCCMHVCSGCPTLDLYHSSDSCMFFIAMVSYCALMSLRAPVRSGLELLSTSIFSWWVWTLTCTSWISCKGSVKKNRLSNEVVVFALMAPVAEPFFCSPLHQLTTSAKPLLLTNS